MCNGQNANLVVHHRIYDGKWEVLDDQASFSVMPKGTQAGMMQQKSDRALEFG
jgi:hypothetical protein